MSLKRLQKRVAASTGLFTSKGDADTFRDKVFTILTIFNFWLDIGVLKIPQDDCFLLFVLYVLSGTSIDRYSICPHIFIVTLFFMIWPVRTFPVVIFSFSTKRKIISNLVSAALSCTFSNVFCVYIADAKEFEVRNGREEGFAEVQNLSIFLDMHNAFESV